MNLKLLTSTIALLCSALPAAALTFNWEVLELDGLSADDCSYSGIDRSWAGPVAEGEGMLSLISSMAEFDDQPLPYSELTIFSCVSEKGSIATWAAKERALEVLKVLRATDANYENWTMQMRRSANKASFLEDSGMLHGQAECACKLHYGIEVYRDRT